MLSDRTRDVARAMALLWTYRPRTAVYHLLRLMGARQASGRAYTQEDVRLAVRELQDRGALVAMPYREGYQRLTDALRARLYREALESGPPARLREALFQLESYEPQHARYYWPVYDPSATVALLRIALFSGMPAAEFEQMTASLRHSPDWGEMLEEAALDAFDGPSFERVDPSWRNGLLLGAAAGLCYSWDPKRVAPTDWALARLDREPEPHTPLTRMGRLNPKAALAGVPAETRPSGQASGRAGATAPRAGADRRYRWAAPAPRPPAS